MKSKVMDLRRVSKIEVSESRREIEQNNKKVILRLQELDFSKIKRQAKIESKRANNP